MQRETRGVARDHRHRNRSTQRRKATDLARTVERITSPLPQIARVVLSTVHEGKTSTGAHARRVRLGVTGRSVELMAYQAHSVQKVIAMPRRGECPKETMIAVAKELRSNGVPICFKKPERRMPS
jgi:hypothetical protein